MNASNQKAMPNYNVSDTIRCTPVSRDARASELRRPENAIARQAQEARS